MPMHDSTRDQILDIMVNDGWANASSGDVDSPMGHFARITNDVADIVSLIDAFGKEAFDIDINFDFSELVGNFLVIKDSAGFLSVYDMPDERTLIAEYDALDNAFGDWL